MENQNLLFLNKDFVYLGKTYKIIKETDYHIIGQCELTGNKIEIPKELLRVGVQLFAAIENLKQKNDGNDAKKIPRETATRKMSIGKDVSR